MKCIVWLLVSIPIFSHAQHFQGEVSDLQKRPIEGAQVFLVSNGEHTHSDYNGMFRLHDVMTGDSLLVSCVGYETVFVRIEDLAQKLTVRLADQIVSLDEVLIWPKLDAMNLLTAIDLQTAPVNSSQELLRKVPGIVIGQHAGGGKAEQIFLRGFDIDHGTDVSISVDGMPVNMVSHAHGQGYADMHFVIPETVDNLSFGKGPYDADQGDFATAGYVAFHTKEKLDNSLVKMEVGQFNTQRMMMMIDLLGTEDHAAYVATEYLSTDGPFDSPQNFGRFNALVKYTGHLSNNDKLSLSGSHFSSRWDASGQVPQRAIDSGLISRFGAIDDTEGGETSRSNLTLDYIHAINENALVNNTFYFSHYDFSLFSNFTFFLEDPVNGDQIHQSESRNLFGWKSEYNHSFHAGVVDGVLQVAAGLRKDETQDSELSHTKNRLTVLDTVQLGDINETNVYGYVSASFYLGKWTINPGIRVDQFQFNYYDKLLSTYETQSEVQTILSPKLNVLYNPSPSTQFYLKGGKGFHSNDARVVVAENGRQTLPAAWGSDFGVMWKPVPKLLVNTALWYLYLQQEFVYVGDAGVVEPSGKTRRMGADFSLRYQPTSWLYWDFDVNYTLARAMGASDGADYIPLAPNMTVMSGLSMIHPSGAYGGLRMRHINDRPANEDNSIIASGYTVVDLNGGYQFGKLDLGLVIQNVFDVDWNETQFATESRLQGESNAVEEIHFTPGTPFYLKASLGYRF